MTRDRDFKKVVRTRMSRTGERYSAARAQLSRGGAKRYSFENLRADAKLALARADANAHAEGAACIRTDHLLLGILEARPGHEGIPLRLRTMESAVRQVIGRLDAVVESPDPAGGISTQAREALAAAFVEARSRASREVGTEHLLRGILAVPDSRGARAISELNADIVAFLDDPNVEAGRWSVRAQLPDYSEELAALLARAHERARRSGAEHVEVEDLLAALDEGSERSE